MPAPVWVPAEWGVFTAQRLACESEAGVPTVPAREVSAPYANAPTQVHGAALWTGADPCGTGGAQERCLGTGRTSLPESSPLKPSQIRGKCTMSLALRSLSLVKSLLAPSTVQTVRQLQRRHFRPAQDFLFRMLFGSNLRALVQVYSADKWDWYPEHYETHFRSIRRRKMNILEIGIGGYDRPEQGGGSLRMWRTYFPNSHIFGIDIHDKSPHNERRIKTFQGSQIDPDLLETVVSEIGPIDIVIDDGSHVNEHVLYTFRYLFPHLSPFGMYVIEDLQTSYWCAYGGSTDQLDSANTSMGFLKRLVDGLNYSEFETQAYDPTYTDTHIVGLHFYHSMAFIQKGPNIGEGGGPGLGRSTQFDVAD